MLLLSVLPSSDCNGGLHLFLNTPMEININMRGFRHIYNFVADEIRKVAMCSAAAQNW